MTERNSGILGVVLAVEMDSHTCGSHKLLQGGTVVEVVVARPQVRLWCQHAEGDISTGERYVADAKDKKKKKHTNLCLQLLKEHSGCLSSSGSQPEGQDQLSVHFHKMS